MVSTSEFIIQLETWVIKLRKHNGLKKEKNTVMGGHVSALTMAED
jgi:hypothetical protein